MLSLKGISVGYSGKVIVRDVSFEVSPGEFCAILGLNGSGKTTLLKAICGLLPILNGQCLVNGSDMASLSEYRRAKYISYVPQRLSILRGVSVLDAVMMGLNSRLGAFEFPSAKDKESALTILSKAGISHLAYTDFSKLSEGQKQVTVLSRALLQDTPIMLMDEPDNALDFLNRHLLVYRFRNLIHSEGKTALVTLHDPNIALNYCDRIILLHDGKAVSDMVLADVSPADVNVCLSKIYGDITLLVHDRKYIVIPR